MVGLRMDETDTLHYKEAPKGFILPGCWYVNVGFRFYSLLSMSASRSSFERPIPSFTVHFRFPPIYPRTSSSALVGCAGVGAMIRSWCV